MANQGKAYFRQGVSLWQHKQRFLFSSVDFAREDVTYKINTCFYSLIYICALVVKRTMHLLKVVKRTLIKS